MSGKLRVGVPAHLAAQKGGSGHGNVWRNVLPRLGEGCELLVREPAAGVGRHATPDVWLLDQATDLAALGDIPVVGHFHEASWADPELAAFLDPGFREWAQVAGDALAGAAARIVAVSESARREVVAAFGLAPERVHAVHSGVDSEFFHPGNEGGRQLVGRALGGEQRPYILYVGVNHPRKNLAALRSAAAGLARRGCEHALALVAGDPADRPDATELRRTAMAELEDAPGRLAWIERPDDRDLAALYAGADAFCLPSFWEGFGLPALEAIASGTPTVVSNRGALPEVVGDAALVVEPDAIAVEEALALVLEDTELARHLAEIGRARALEFTWERTAAGYLEVLEKAAKEG